MIGKCMMGRGNIERAIRDCRRIKEPIASRMFYSPKGCDIKVAQLASAIAEAAAIKESHILPLLQGEAPKEGELAGDILSFVGKVRREKDKFRVTENGLEEKAAPDPSLNELDLIRENVVFQALVWNIRSIAKADRHCHLSASISREYIYGQVMQWDEKRADLFAAKNPPPKEPATKEKDVKTKLNEVIQMVKARMGSGISWEEAWNEKADRIREIVYGINSTKDFDISIFDLKDFLDAFSHVVKGYYRDGITEVNIRFKPQKDYCSTSELLTALNALCTDLEKENEGLKIRFVFCYNRENFRKDPAILKRFLDEVKGLPGPLKQRLVKIDLSGQEISFDLPVKDGPYVSTKTFFNSNFLGMDFLGYPLILHLNDPGYMRGPEKDGSISWHDRLKAHFQYMSDTMGGIGKVDSIGHLWTLLPSTPEETPLIVKGGNLEGMPLTGTFKEEANHCFQTAKDSKVMFEQLPIVYDSKVKPAVAKYMFPPFYYWVRAGLPFDRIITGVDNSMYRPGMTLSETLAFFMLFSPEETRFSYQNILGMATRDIK